MRFFLASMLLSPRMKSISIFLRVLAGISFFFDSRPLRRRLSPPAARRVVACWRHGCSREGTGHSTVSLLRGARLLRMARVQKR